MTTIHGFSAARSKAIEDSNVTDADVVSNRLILKRNDGGTIDAGDVTGAKGFKGPTGDPGPSSAGGALVRIGTDATTYISNNTLTVLDLPIETFDYLGMHDPSGSPSRITCTQAGVYLCSGQIEYQDATSQSGLRSAGIRKNGTSPYLAYATAPTAINDGTRVPVSCMAQLAVGDYIQLFAYQTSGNTVGTNYSNVFLSLAKLV